MIRGTKREMVTTPTKRFDVDASIHNRFDIEVVDAVSGKVKRKAYAENVICSKLWDLMIGGSSYNTGVHYGGGSGTPSSSDTSLFSFIGYQASSVYSTKYDYDNNVYSATKKAVLAETIAVGQTITEVGIASGSGASNLVTHAMLKDMNGNPVSLEKGDTDIFNIYATVFVHLSLPEGVRCFGTTKGGSLATTNSFYNTTYLGFLASFAGLRGTPTPEALLAAGYCLYYSEMTNPTVSRDVTGKKIVVKYPRLGASEWNSFHGIKTLFLGHQPISTNSNLTAEFAFEVDEDCSWYPKTEIRGEAIGTGDGSTKDFATSINFAKGGVVYVDGVPVEANFDCGCARGLGHYFRLIRLPASGSYTYSSNHYPAMPFYEKPSDGKIYLRCNASGKNSLRPVFENVLYETHGVLSVAGTYKYVAVSDDLKTWTVLCNAESGTLMIPEQHQYKRYWMMHSTNYANDGTSWTFTPVTPVPTSVNVHLSEAPPEGAVITADYDAICVGKDANHVFDFSVTFQFNEYNEG